MAYKQEQVHGDHMWRSCELFLRLWNGYFTVHSKVIVHYDVMICTRRNDITHYDVTMDVPSNTIIQCDVIMSHVT